jgi:long-chain acyl-CoA synthetase
MAGYWHRPDETAEVLVDGWFHTGDVGELLPSGHLRILDRKRAILVLSTGKNVVPLAICQALEASPWIEQAVLLGDRRKYVAALLSPDLTQLSAWAESQGLATLEPAAILRHPTCQSLIEAEIAARTAGFAAFERPKRWAWVDEPFTEENGQLTPTLKIKTRVVEERYRALIATLYPDDDTGGLATPSTR